jgi:hypothetical protein
MKRFRELVADVRDRFPADDFFADFENSCWVEPAKRKHYRSYNEALMLLDDESWNILKEKAIEHFKDERDGQRKQSLFNQLNESFAYRYLLHEGFENVRFIKEGKKKKPDISFIGRGTESYCEVKTVGISDDGINRRSSHRVHDGGVYFNLSTGFQNKLEADINLAWEQIHSFGESGLVFILVRFDDMGLDHYGRYRKQLTEFCRKRGFENLIIKIGHRGNKRIRI